MSSIDGDVRVVQIYPRLSQDTLTYCPLQINEWDTASAVINNAVVTLGLSAGHGYRLLEVRQNGAEERTLDAEDRPLDRVLLWPPKAQKWHPQSDGYYFVLQPAKEGDGTSFKEDCDDLCNLDPVTEENILAALRERFQKHKIYTYASNVLVAVNPNKFLPAYYNPKYVKMYEKQPLGKLSPHIFAIADQAYRAMLQRQAHQCVVLSGERASGKTESSSFLIHCLTALSQKTYCCGLERSILGASPVLEAFGNARTADNDNSSRFGKFLQLNYLASGVMRGAVIKKYLLEKSRLVSRDPHDRNFHVFHYLLVGASKEEQNEFHLQQPQHYFYLQQDHSESLEEEKLRQEYKRLHQAMEMVGFLTSTKRRIFSVLSAILHVGNVTFTPNADVLEVGPGDVLTALCDLLKVKKELLVKALTHKRVQTSNGSVFSPHTLEEATVARDSMAKSLYGVLFDWIVLRINHALFNRRDMEESVSCLSIGVLDMFGFENLQRNRFEQLCINYTSETLTFYVNRHVFQLQQEGYLEEDLVWESIYYMDNSQCLELLGQKETGLFHLLDEESNDPQASHESLTQKFQQQHQDDPFFFCTCDQTFVVRHFAGSVTYQVEGFREKNCEQVSPVVVSLLRSSEKGFLHQLVTSSPRALFRWGVLRATVRILAVFRSLGRRRTERMLERRSSKKSLKELQQRRSKRFDRLSSQSLTLEFSFDRSDEHPLDVFDIFTNYEKRKKSRGNRQKQLIPKNLMDLKSLQHIVGLTSHDQTFSQPRQDFTRPTVGFRFQASLEKLMQTLNASQPSFIFCIRSNAEKKELLFDDDLVLRQIKYTGLKQVVRIQKAGYSASFTFQEFFHKFRLLLPRGSSESNPDLVGELLEKLRLDKNSYQIGKTKVFLKQEQRQMLQDTLNKEVMRRIVILQRWFRSCLIRSHFLHKKDATLIIQRSWREFYDQRSRAATVIQSAWRSSLKKSSQLNEADKEGRASEARHGRDSLNRRGLRRQHKIEVSPNRQTQPTTDEVNGQETREGRGSPPALSRPHSVPLDARLDARLDADSVSPSKSSSLQRYTDGGIKEKAEKWRERISEGEPTDESSPEVRRRRDADRRESLKFKGKSMSVDELSKISSSGSDSSPSTREGRVRFRRQPKRKRRLAYARSGLMLNFAGSKESEYWSFPLPPMSPQVDVRDLQGEVQTRRKALTEPDGSRFSLPAMSGNEDSEQQGSNRDSQLTTPEKVWFLSRFLRKKTPKVTLSNEPLSPDKAVTLRGFTPNPYHMPDQNRVTRNPTIHISRATRALQWNSSLDREITDPKELRSLDEFLGNQVNDLHTRIKQLSATESIFLTATREFRHTIKGMYSVQKPKIGYKDLMKGYQNKVHSLAGPKQRNEVSLVVNLFQSVLDGFIRGELKRTESEPVKATKTTKKRRKKDKCPDGPLDHLFSTSQVNIMQSCDLCGSYIWGMEKAYMCSACKLICHKKCLNNIITDCSTRRARQDENTPGSLHFGVQVCVLTSKANPVPKVVELLLMHVELNGLYTEGIYRKSGSTTRARELHQILETNPESVCLDNYPIHTITGLVKRWLRELPDPLMTFALYSDFLHAAELPERPERIRAVYQKVDELPPSNYNTLERLVFHLVRVTKEETHNKMSTSSLAIIFAPCILRSPHVDDPFLGMRDVGKTTTCVEILISEQLRRYNEKMQNIQELEYAEALAVNQLRLRRQNTVVEKPCELDVMDQVDSDERTLMERIKSIKQEKVDLACTLPDLEQENSDNDNMDSVSSMSSDSLDDRLCSLDSEVKVKPDRPHKPSDLAHRIRRLLGLADPEETPPAPKTPEEIAGFQASPEESSAGESVTACSDHLEHLEHPDHLDHLDIPYIDEDQES